MRVGWPPAWARAPWREVRSGTVPVRASCRHPAIGHWAIVGRERVNVRVTDPAPASVPARATGPIWVSGRDPAIVPAQATGPDPVIVPAPAIVPDLATGRAPVTGPSEIPIELHRDTTAPTRFDAIINDIPITTSAAISGETIRTGHVGT